MEILLIPMVWLLLTGLLYALYRAHDALFDLTPEAVDDLGMDDNKGRFRVLYYYEHPETRVALAPTGDTLKVGNWVLSQPMSYQAALDYFDIFKDAKFVVEVRAEKADRIGR